MYKVNKKEDLPKNVYRQYHQKRKNKRKYV